MLAQGWKEPPLISKKRAVLLGSALVVAGVGSFVVTANATASPTAGSACAPHGAVTRTRTQTLLCAPTATSPAYRWREVTGARGPAGAPGRAGTAGAPGKNGAPGAPGKDGKDGVDGKDGKDGKDGVLNIQSDGPYPGATQVQGHNSTEPFKADGGAHIQTAWVRCPDGKVATGGGFTVQGGADDNGGDNAKAIQITGSFPFDLKADGTFGGSDIKPDDSLRPNAWVVKGFNNGLADLTVRPFVVCVTAG